MRIKEILLLFIILATISCTTVNQIDKQKELPAQKVYAEEERAFEALLLNSYADYAEEMQEIEMASIFLKRAVDRYPESQYLKEKFIVREIRLAISGMREPQEIIQLGEDLLISGDFNCIILNYLASYFIIQGDSLSAKKYLDAGLDSDCNKQFYFTYYNYQKRYAPPANIDYLEKAVEKPWHDGDENQILTIANEYNNMGNFLEAAELLLEAYQRWDLEVFTDNIFLQFATSGLSEKLRQTMEELLEEDRLPLELFQYLLEDYVARNESSKIISLEEECRKSGDDYSLRVLFGSAFYEKNYELALEIGELLLIKDEIDVEVEMMIRSSMYLMSFELDKWDKALEYFNSLDSGYLQYHTLESIREIYGSDEMIIAFLENSYRFSEEMNKNRALLFLVIYNRKAKNYDRIDELLSLLPYETFSDVANIRILAGEISNEKNDLASVDHQTFSSYFEKDPGLAGMFYYYLNQEDEALDFFRIALKDTALDFDEIMVYFQILDDLKIYDEMNTLLKRAVNDYPDNAVILNLYGYCAADYQWEREYSEADSAITRALEIEPDNSGYWDSLGWLYYRMGRYTEALASMEKTSEDAEDNALIAYHYGIILSVNGMFDSARKYLEIVSKISDDESMIEEAHKTLKLIENINQED